MFDANKKSGGPGEIVFTCGVVAIATASVVTGLVCVSHAVRGREDLIGKTWPLTMGATLLAAGGATTLSGRFAYGKGYDAALDFADAKIRMQSLNQEVEAITQPSPVPLNIPIQQEFPQYAAPINSVQHSRPIERVAAVSDRPGFADQFAALDL